jgi:ribosome modulation factor
MCLVSHRLNGKGIHRTVPTVTEDCMCYHHWDTHVLYVFCQHKGSKYILCEKSVLKRICLPKREEITGSSRKLHRRSSIICPLQQMLLRSWNRGGWSEGTDSKHKNLRVSDHLVHLGVDEKIILKTWCQCLGWIYLVLVNTIKNIDSIKAENFPV